MLKTGLKLNNLSSEASQVNGFREVVLAVSFLLYIEKYLVNFSHAENSFSFLE